MLNCAHFHPGLAHIAYSSASVGSTSYFVVYAEIAPQVEHRQGAGIREGADQWYFTVYTNVDAACRIDCSYQIIPST